MEENQMRRMFIVGSDAFLVTAMRLALRYGSGISVLGMLADEPRIGQAIRDAEPDIIVIDAAFPERALARLREVSEARPTALVVLIASELDADLFERAAEQGALACLGAPALALQLRALLAEPARTAVAANGHAQIALAGGNGNGNGSGHRPDLETAVARRPPAEPECPLTNRELEILRAVAEGHTNARIGRELWVTEQTVKFHLSKIYRKLGVANRTEASRYAFVNNLFAPRRPSHGPGASVNGNGHRVLDHAAR
jgi:DNA-binding NarL/FixJ family response regulator